VSGDTRQRCWLFGCLKSVSPFLETGSRQTPQQVDLIALEPLAARRGRERSAPQDLRRDGGSSTLPRRPTPSRIAPSTASTARTAQHVASARGRPAGLSSTN
jgi:hypothetical protein